MTSRAEMLRAIDEHDADRSRLVADMVRARLDIHNAAKVTAELEHERDIRQAVYDAVRNVKTALAGCDAMAQARVDEHLNQAGIALRVAQAMLREQLGIVECADCGCSDEHEELKPAPGVSRDVLCESCMLRREREEGVGF